MTEAFHKMLHANVTCYSFPFSSQSSFPTKFLLNGALGETMAGFVVGKMKGKKIK